MAFVSAMLQAMSGTRKRKLVSAQMQVMSCKPAFVSARSQASLWTRTLAFVGRSNANARMVVRVQWARLATKMEQRVVVPAMRVSVRRGIIARSDNFVLAIG